MGLPHSEVLWHLVRSGKPYGPLSDLEMLKFIELGHLEPTDLLWREGFSEWRHATAVFPELQEVGNPSHTDPVDSSIIVGEPFVAARSLDRRATSRRTLTLAFFLIIVLGGAASYAYLRSDWLLSGTVSPPNPGDRDEATIKFGSHSGDGGKN